jgi:tetratricopeptide (TPR) repeat protein
MSKRIAGFIFFSLTLFASCSNNDGATNAVLEGPPYNNITDSIDNEPKNAALYFKRGALLYKNNQLQLAEQDVKKAWNLSPTEEYGLSVANILSKKNQDSAIVFLQKATQQLPQSIALKVDLARKLFEKNENQKALEQTNDVLTAYPNQIDALLLKADILKEENQPAEALATLEKAYSFAPFDVELSYNLAFEYAQNKNAKALTLSDSLLSKETEQTHAEPYYFKALYYENTGNTKAAIDQLNKAIQHNYYFLDAYMEKGEILYSQKKYNEALQTFSLAITVSPTFADAYYWMGKTQEALNQKAEAKLSYQRAYGLDKSLTEAKAAAAKL